MLLFCAREDVYETLFSEAHFEVVPSQEPSPVPPIEHVSFVKGDEIDEAVQTMSQVLAYFCPTVLLSAIF